MLSAVCRFEDNDMDEEEQEQEVAIYIGEGIPHVKWATLRLVEVIP
jgi:hypothetical protein